MYLTTEGPRLETASEIQFFSNVADIVGITGGYLVTVGLFDTSSIVYWKRTWDYLQMSDIYNGLLKEGFFGARISLISC